jgi:hypothetical protein
MSWKCMLIQRKSISTAPWGIPGPITGHSGVGHGRGLEMLQRTQRIATGSGPSWRVTDWCGLIVVELDWSGQREAARLSSGTP